MTPSTLDISRQGAVARVFLNRPDVRNAFNDAVIAELTAAFRDLGGDTSLRAIVLGGHGKAFCAGGDLNWMRAMADAENARKRARADIEAARELMAPETAKRIRDLPKGDALATAQVAGILGQHDISLVSVLQKERAHGEAVPVVMMTHEARERDMRAALAGIDTLPVVASRTTMIRVEPA